MAFNIYEKFESGSGDEDQNTKTDELQFIVRADFGDDVDDNDATVWARENVDQTYGGKPLAGLRRLPINDTTWLFFATYASGTFTPTGEKTFTFSTAGGTQHVKHALQHVATFTNDLFYDDNPAFDGWINPTADGDVDGTDIPTRAFEFSIGAYVHPDDMTADYVELLYLLAGTTNATAFTATVQGVSFTFPAGSCFHKGCTGSLRGYGDWELTLNFAANPNITGRTIGDITDIEAKGWEYISIVSEKSVGGGGDGKFIAPKAKYVLVDQVFPEDNWTGLLPTA